jgi:cell division protein FtsB
MTAGDTLLVLAVSAIFLTRIIMALDALTAAVHAASASITNLSAKVVALKAQVADLTSQLDVLKNDAATSQALADELNAAVAAAPQD